MVVAVSILVVAAVITVLACVFVAIRRLYRAAGPPPERTFPTSGTAYGGLPELSPVAELGRLSPGAPIGDPGASPDDLYGS